jgi:aspartate aminotransferase
MNLDKEYSFPDGIPSFRARAMKMAYGEEHPGIQEDRIASMQTVSGTGALH